MNAPEFFVIMLLARLVIPFGILFGFGETVRRRHLGQMQRMAGRL